MAEIVNLRRVKKARARQQAGTEAAENRARHGRTKAERVAIKAETARQTRTLDGAELQRDREPRE